MHPHEHNIHTLRCTLYCDSTELCDKETKCIIQAAVGLAMCVMQLPLTLPTSVAILYKIIKKKTFNYLFIMCQACLRCRR
jgi:hypothetical protein